jgi:hypothetical protein
MAFIDATWTYSRNTVSLNVDHIVAVYVEDNRTIIQTDATLDGGLISYEVSQSRETIMRLINAAQQADRLNNSGT